MPEVEFAERSPSIPEFPEGMTISDERPSYFIQQRLKDLPGHSLNNPSYKPRKVLFRHHDGRLLSGCGGDVEVFHPLELERSQSTGLPVRGTVVTVFGGKDTVIGIKVIDQGDHFLVHGERYCCLLHQAYLVEGGAVPEHRKLRLPAPIRSLNVERHGKNDLLLSFLLENGIFHYGLSTHLEETTFECLQCHRCTRPIQSGLLWRDGGVLHVAYYDGYIRVGVIVEQYEDMLLVQLADSSLPKSCEGEDKEDEEISATHAEFYALKVEFRNHSIRADRVTQRLATLKKLLQISQKAVETNLAIDKSIELTQSELDQLIRFSKTHNDYVKNGDYNMIIKSGTDFEERKYAIQDLSRKLKVTETKSFD